jgi:hypothetical protein
MLRGPGGNSLGNAIVRLILQFGLTIVKLPGKEGPSHEIGFRFFPRASNSYSSSEGSVPSFLSHESDLHSG